MNKNDLIKLLDNITNDSTPIKKATFHKHDRVLVIDGLNLFLRNFAVLNYINQDGTHIGGLGGFLRSLGSLINTNKPTSVYIVFDGVGSSINRKNLLPEYKSGRNLTRITNHVGFGDIDEEQDSKLNQITRLIHYLKCLPVNLISIDKVEADDIIAYLTHYMSTKYNSKCIIVSADKDFLQIVNDNITVYSPIVKEFYTPKLVKEKFGLPSYNFILYKTLMGDNSDKIIGVPGLGPKKLFKLFPELTSEKLTLEDIFEISTSRYKENVLYSKIIFEEERIRNNYKIMNLSNPMMGDDEKLYVETIVEQPIESTNIVDFIKMYNEDGLGHILKNVEYWLRSTFMTLNGFK